MIQHPNGFEPDVPTTETSESGSERGTVSAGQDTTDPEASSSGTEVQFSSDVKPGFEELCPVCGDKVSGYHYGLLTCESCKGFFKRTVQNKKVYSCVDNRSCHIDKSQRKRCPYCRFQKCLNVGMKLEAVRTDRMRGGRNKFGPMYKRDRALKQQVLRQQHHMLTSCQLRMANGMTPLSTEPPDIKPDPALLMSVASSMNYGMHSSPMGSAVPSPTVPESPAADLRLPSNFVSSVTSPLTTSSASQGVVYSTSQSYQSSLVSPLQTNFLHGNPYHQAVPHPASAPVVPQLILDLKGNMADETEIKQKLLSFIQSEFVYEDYSNYHTKLLRLLCQLSDQLLFLMVEWARTSVFFKELKVEDQMKLLQHSWSEILILDLAQRLVRQCWSGSIVLASGHKLSLDCLDELGLSDMKESILDLVHKMKELKIDSNEYTCLKFLILLNTDVRDLENPEFVEECQEKVNAALMEYCLNFYPNVKDKFGHVLLRLPEVKLASLKGEEFLYYKHMIGEMPEQTLLMEMLHSKKK